MGTVRKNGEHKKNGEFDPKQFWIEGECLRERMRREKEEEKRAERKWWRKWRT